MRARRMGALRDRILPGVPAVAAQIAPYAATWAERNATVLAQPIAPARLWVALGDSMSQGIGAATVDLGWVPQAAARLAEVGHDYRVVNLSRTGAYSSDVLDFQLPALRDLAQQPDLVTVLVGANDIFQSSRRRGLVARFAQILDELPVGAVVARLPQPIPLARHVNELIDLRAEQGRVVGVDMRPAARRWRGHRAPDLFHPNERGYARIASRFVNAVLAHSSTATPTQ